MPMPSTQRLLAGDTDSIEFVLIDGYYTQVRTFEWDDYATYWIRNHQGLPVLVDNAQLATMVSVPATVTFMASNGNYVKCRVTGF